MIPRTGLKFGLFKKIRVELELELKVGLKNVIQWNNLFQNTKKKPFLIKEIQETQ